MTVCWSRLVLVSRHSLLEPVYSKFYESLELSNIDGYDMENNGKADQNASLSQWFLRAGIVKAVCIH